MCMPEVRLRGIRAPMPGTATEQMFSNPCLVMCGNVNIMAFNSEILETGI